VRSRTLELLKCFVTGMVSDLPRALLDKRQNLWTILADHESFLKTIDQQSVARRNSMYETATRSQYLAVIDAFVVAAGAQIMVAPDTHGASAVLLKIGVITLFVAAMVFVLAISAKSKVWKKPRSGGFSEADEMLTEAVRVQEQVKTEPHKRLAAERDRAFLRLHKRKLVLAVERRAQHAGAGLSVLGMLEVIIGVALR